MLALDYGMAFLKHRLSFRPSVYLLRNSWLQGKQSKKSTVNSKNSTYDVAEFRKRLANKLSILSVLDTLSLTKTEARNAIDSAVGKLTETIMKCVMKSRLRLNWRDKNKLGLWTNNLWELRHRLRTAFKNVNKTESKTNKEHYKRCKADYQREIRRQKRASWEKFFSYNLNNDLFSDLKKLEEKNRTSFSAVKDEIWKWNDHMQTHNSGGTGSGIFFQKKSQMVLTRRR